MKIALGLAALPITAVTMFTVRPAMMRLITLLGALIVCHVPVVWAQPSGSTAVPPEQETDLPDVVRAWRHKDVTA